jgi:hypothetical protein
VKTLKFGLWDELLNASYSYLFCISQHKACIREMVSRKSSLEALRRQGMCDG